VSHAAPLRESDGGFLYGVASDVEEDERLAAEMGEWDATVGDGLAPGAAPPRT
jgi:hypothetical protein